MQYRPQAARQFARDRDVRHDRRLTVIREPPVAAVEPGPSPVGECYRPSRLALPALPQCLPDPRRVSVVPGALHEQPPHMAVPVFVIGPRRWRAPLPYSLGAAIRRGSLCGIWDALPLATPETIALNRPMLVPCPSRRIMQQTRRLGHPAEDRGRARGSRVV